MLPIVATCMVVLCQKHQLQSIHHEHARDYCFTHNPIFVRPANDVLQTNLRIRPSSIPFRYPDWLHQLFGSQQIPFRGSIQPSFLLLPFPSNQLYLFYLLLLISLLLSSFCSLTLQSHPPPSSPIYFICNKFPQSIPAFHIQAILALHFE